MKDPEPLRFIHHREMLFRKLCHVWHLLERELA